MTTDTRKRVLIAGASIAGPTAAYWFAHAGNGTLFDVTVLERASEFRTAGQGIDVRGAGVEVMRRMDLEEKIRSSSSHEEGVHFVDDNGRPIASFPVGGGELLTSDIEIPRGELAALIAARAKSVGVKFVYGDYVAKVEGNEDSAGGEKEGSSRTPLRVTYAKSGETHDFDLLIAADGLFSKTRDIVFGAEAIKKATHSVGAFVAYFTIPKESSDDRWSRWYNAIGRRTIFTRPETTGKATSALLCVCTYDPVFDDAVRSGADLQKQLWTSTFKGTGWETERVLRGMNASSDFYMQKLAQVRLPNWVRGRVALLGDAGYCPTPLTGMGTSCAIVGAYVLAGEVARTPEDIDGALRRYEERLRPFVERAQKIPPGAPWIMNPETWWGIWIQRTLLSLVSWSRVYLLAATLGSWISPPANAIELPDYAM